MEAAILPEPSGVFNPSALQRDVVDGQDHDQEQEDADEMRDIAAGIDNQLKDLGDDLDLEEDDDSDLGIEEEAGFDHRHLQQQQQQFKEHLFQGNEVEGIPEGQVALQVLYEARGHQIQKLQSELARVEASQSQETRTIRHQLTLLKGENERLSARTEHLTDVADGQVEENRKLRDQVQQLHAKLDLTSKAKDDLAKELEASNLMVVTLQGQVSEMQRSDGVLKAKHHHDQSVRSLRERHEMEVLRLNREIEKLGLSARAKDNESQVLRGQMAKVQRDHDLAMMDKHEVIRGLQERLDAAQKRLAQSISEAGAQGYNSVKAMHQRYQQDQENYANDVVAFSDEIKALEKRLQAKEAELTASNGKLAQVTEKYGKLKGKARQYQTHCRNKEERYLAQLKSNENDYRQKVLGLKSKMEEAYTSKERQIETELLDMKLKFNEELKKALRLHDLENDDDDLVISEAASAAERGVPNDHAHRAPPPSTATNQLQQNPLPPETSDDLCKMFELAKNGVRHELKRPSSGEPSSSN